MIKRIPIVILLVLLSVSINAQEVWMAGPTFHVNFGNKQIKLSYGFEVSYWNIIGFPYSVDGGIEFSRKRMALYSEAQTGIGLTGVSFGPVLNIGKSEGVKLGVQGSCWINYFLGFDFRIRYINGTYYQCPGSYIKLPLNYKVVSDELDKYNSQHHHDDDIFDD
jgi:hypothetical protein